MRSPVLDLLFPGGRPLAYAAEFNGQPYATQWTVYRGLGPGGLHELEFFLEMDAKVFQLGTGLLRQRSVLLADDRFSPIRYESYSSAGRVVLDIGRETVEATLPDGSKHTVARGGAEGVVEANMSGQQALALALAGPSLFTGETRLSIFILNQLVASPYRLTPADDLPGRDGARWLRSSFQEELLVRDDGLLLEGHIPAQGITGRLIEEPPPVPQWSAAELQTVDPIVYVPPDDAAFAALDLTIDGPVVPIGGTLTVPAGDGPFPAVLFLSGSGTHDRHGIAGEIDIGTHEVIDFLAENGFVGLRTDTRGAGTTRLGPDSLEFGLDAIIADSEAALDALRARPEVDATRVFLIGHSQGGQVALALAARHPVAGVVLMAAIGRGIDEILEEQTRAQGERLGSSADQVAQQLDQLREYVDVVRSGRPFEADQVPDYLLAGVRNRTWFDGHLRYIGAELITRVPCPVMNGQGGQDFQVSPVKDAERLRDAAQAAGVDASFQLFPALDHLFKPVEGVSEMKQYFDRSRHVDPGFLAALRGWLTARAAAGSNSNTPS